MARDYSTAAPDDKWSRERETARQRLYEQLDRRQQGIDDAMSSSILAQRSEEAELEAAAASKNKAWTDEALQGAALGTMVSPGYGTLIGGAAGAGLGILKGGISGGEAEGGGFGGFLKATGKSLIGKENVTEGIDTLQNNPMLALALAKGAAAQGGPQGLGPNAGAGGVGTSARGSSLTANPELGASAAPAEGFAFSEGGAAPLEVAPPEMRIPRRRFG